jgi:hypothetical protein
VNEEVLRILKMVEEGKIDAEKASQLIDAVQVQKVEIDPVDYEDRMIRIKVDSNDGDNVKINVPVKFVKGMLKSVGKIKLGEGSGIEKVDPEIIAQAIDGNLTGKIVDIQSGDGDIVEISIE